MYCNVYVCSSVVGLCTEYDVFRPWSTHRTPAPGPRPHALRPLPGGLSAIHGPPGAEAATPPNSAHGLACAAMPRRTRAHGRAAAPDRLTSRRSVSLRARRSLPCRQARSFACSPCPLGPIHPSVKPLDRLNTRNNHCRPSLACPMSMALDRVPLHACPRFVPPALDPWIAAAAP